MQKRIKQAFILGAGLGTRLRPITNTVPKVMVPIHGKMPLLEHTVRLLKKQRIEEFIINVHYLPEKIKEHFGDGSNLGVKISYSDETKRLMDTAGAIKKAGNFLDENFIFVYGDQLHFFNFAKVVNLHFQNNAIATIVLKKSDLPQNGEVALIDPKTNKISQWFSRPHPIQKLGEHHYMNSGLFILSKKIIRHIPENQPANLDKEVLPRLMKNGEKIFAFPTKEDIFDIGTPEKYEFAKNWYKKKHLVWGQHLKKNRFIL